MPYIRCAQKPARHGHIMFIMQHSRWHSFLFFAVHSPGMPAPLAGLGDCQPFLDHAPLSNMVGSIHGALRRADART